MHAAPRFPRDLDVWVNAAGETLQGSAALQRFGAPLAALGPTDLATPGIVFPIGLEPNRIDVLTSIDGVTFPEAWPSPGPRRRGPSGAGRARIARRAGHGGRAS